MSIHDDVPPPTDDDYNYGPAAMSADGVAALGNVVPIAGRKSKTKRGLLSAAAFRRHHRWLDTEFADEFYNRYGTDFHFVVDSQAWLTWTGRYWRDNDHERGIDQLAEHFTKEMLQEAKDAPVLEGEDEEELKRSSISRMEARLTLGRIRDLVGLASTRHGVEVEADNLNRRTWLLSVGNVTLDLRTGDVFGHRREDLATHVTNVMYDSTAACPIWEDFLSQCFGGNDEMIDFMQRLSGYTLTGETKEQKLFFLWGPGGRGKGTFTETLAAILGRHAQAVDKQFIELSQSTPHPTMLAATAGKRLVYVSETSQGKMMDVVRVKQFTGEDTVTARKMRQDDFTFRPIAKLFVSGNHKPVITEVDEAIWRRMVLIGFERPVASKDKDLRQKLLGELPGILAWAVRGASAWYDRGLDVPASVVAATAKYRAEQDNFGAFARECLVFEPGAKIKGTDFAALMAQWFGENGSLAPGRKEVTNRMEALGVLRPDSVIRIGSDVCRGWAGVRRRTQSDDTNCNSFV